MGRIEKPIEKPCRRRHDWRMTSRDRIPYVPGREWGGWQEVWYCTRCRRVEELFVPK